ncbi:MerR family transcriptional regulator [Paracoccus sp. 11-3]|uniref:MerR family transcriptional regulator n=1 Tax=Paracoccus amoyensis TaxID=2760093 RepID=A0A926JDI9_9RHOB|nr:MerR family transcriptional regulator [Paracoccus amoyensis]MBC9247689.1 MerR family transcriptional regulator [Paracoccus amoyensis]
MAKSAEAFRSIGEVAKLIGVAPHVLRYWETQFPLLKPMKRPDGRRYYRPDDVLLAAGLCDVLRDEGLTIRGAKKMMTKDRGQSVRERGALRLGDAPAEPQPQDAPAIPTEAVFSSSEPTPAIAASHPSDTKVILEDLPDPEDGSDWEDEEMPQHGPRSRQRKRRSLGDSGALPLFPELERENPDIQWLARLVILSKKLHALTPENAAWQRSRHVGIQLGDAIQRLY